VKINFDLVIFGGCGDLSIRKLMPALYRCESEGFFDDDVRIFVTARSLDLTDEDYGDKVVEGLLKYLEDSEYNEDIWQRFKQRLHALSLDLSSDDGAQWSHFSQRITALTQKSQIFYFAIPANLYGATCKNLAEFGFAHNNCRVVLEKPIGYDLESSARINTEVAEYYSEAQIFRIDHYLGKESVQNLVALRFGNIFFEHLWDNKSVDHVQITLSETVGLESRASFYDQAGALRDMVQNHLLQLFCFVAMDPPSKLTADNVRSEKIKLMQALRPFSGEDVHNHAVAGQYVAGDADGEAVTGYLHELDKPSNTETYVALKVHVDNWRWQGVPFYFRTGKRMKQRFAEIVIQYKSVSHNVFPDSAGQLQPNKLVIRIQPEESVQLTMMTKKLNQTELALEPVALDFSSEYSRSGRDAYKRLLLDAARNNSTLFVHREEVTEAWEWLNPVLSEWQSAIHRPYAYEAGSWGPKEADAMLAKDGHEWHGHND
jgi:glucose-6-phosphate 1-dehydrogenase